LIKKTGPADLVPVKKEPGMEPDQLHQPLTKENQVDADDIKHVYNPDKKPTPQNYSKGKASGLAHKDGDQNASEE